ncbi:MAG: hypothetical protein AAB865_00900 [Patescibacteria group bacterium]
MILIEEEAREELAEEVESSPVPKVAKATPPVQPARGETATEAERLQSASDPTAMAGELMAASATLSKPTVWQGDPRDPPKGLTVVSNASALDMRSLKAGLEPVQDEIELCNWDDIRRATPEQPKRSGMLEFDYIIGLDGHATVTRVRKDTMRHPELTRCVTEAIGHLRVMAPSAPTTIRHPLEFQQF